VTCVVAEMHWGAEMTTRVGGTPCRRVRAVAGRCRGQKRRQRWMVHLAIAFMWPQEGTGGREDSDGGCSSSLLRSCGHNVTIKIIVSAYMSS
jgi:hypothetical protein